MDVRELIESLSNLESKVLHYEGLEHKLEEKKKLREEEQGKVIKNPKKVLPEATPQPNEVPEGAQNLLRYDNDHMPKNISLRRSWAIFLSVLFSMILIYAIERFGLHVFTFVILIAAIAAISFVIRLKNPNGNYANKHREGRDEAYRRDLEAEQKRFEMQCEKYRNDVEKRDEILRSIDGEIEATERELADFKPEIDTDETVPDIYKYSDVLGLIIGYLINRRADSLKEAINLYESEKREILHNVAMENYARMQTQNSQRQREAAEQAARSAELQRQAAERAASEAARQRQVAENAAEQQRRSAERIEAEARRQRKATEKATEDIRKKLDEQ